MPVETVTVHSSQYYALESKGEEEREKGEKEEGNWQDETISDKNGFWSQREGKTAGEEAAEQETVNGKTEDGEAKGQTAGREMGNLDSVKEGRGYAAATQSNAVSIKTEVFPGEEVDLENVWILDEDGTYEEDSEDDLEDERGLEIHKASSSNARAFAASASNASPSNADFPGMVRLLPGMIRKIENQKEDKNSERKQGWQDGNRPLFRRLQQNDRDDDAGSARGSVTMEESKIAPLSLADPDYSGSSGADWTFVIYDHRTEAVKSQGDGTLEGAVYGLYAGEDLIHPDGKTGVVFEKGNLVAVAATDKNGDASFMAVTEAPGTIYDYDI